MSAATCCDGGANGCPECRPILWRPVLRCEFTMPNGDLLVGEWTMFEARPFAEIPSWLDNPRKSWLLPNPVTYRGDVRPGFEREALEFVAGVSAPPPAPGEAPSEGTER